MSKNRLSPEIPVTGRALQRQVLLGGLAALLLLLAGAGLVHWRHAQLVACVERMCLADVGTTTRALPATAAWHRFREAEVLHTELINALAAAGLLVLLLGLCWALVYVLRRVNTLCDVLARANAGEKGLRLVSSRHDELAALAEHCNSLLTRCDQAAGAALLPAPPRRRVLLVEDAPHTRRALAIGLRKAGWEVTLAEDGAEALEKAQTEPFDLLLMDMELPLTSGYEAVRRLRLEGYSGRIVGLCAAADRQKCLDAGCDLHYAKPLDATTLRELAEQPNHPLAGGSRPR